MDYLNPPPAEQETAFNPPWNWCGEQAVGAPFDEFGLDDFEVTDVGLAQSDISLEGCSLSFKHDEVRGKCEYCEPDEDGHYNMDLYTNPSDPNTVLLFSLCDKNITINAKKSLEDEGVILFKKKFKYCPMCGRMANFLQ